MIKCPVRSDSRRAFLIQSFSFLVNTAIINVKCMEKEKTHMSQVKDLVRKINKGKDLDENIPAYKNILFDLYNQVSVLHVTLEYYMLYETLQEKTGEENGYLQETISVVNQLVKDTFCGESLTAEEKQEKIDLLVATRSDVIRKMKVLTMYTDKLQIFEHVINRIELKYEKEFPMADIDTFVQKVYQYIFSGKDNVVINESIKEILAELPVRMARSKYFQLIENSLSVYKESDRSAVDRYIYMLETSAMLYEPDGVEEYFLDVKEFTERLGKMKFADLSESEFHKVYDELEETAEYISEVADLYVEIESVLNSLYCYLTSEDGQPLTDASDKACVEMLQCISGLFEDGEWKEVPDSLDEKLVLTEGKQEKLVEDMLQLETVLVDLQISHREKLEQLNLIEDFVKLDTIQQLLAASGTFIEFNEEEEEKTADEAYIAEQTQQLLEKLKTQFAENEMCINRAVIAATISKFPVFFTSSKEVEEYIREALERCQDDAERQASMNVIQAIMEG